MTQVLVIDDDVLMRDLIEDALQEDGFETITAQDGDDGLSKVRAGRPDAILLDIMMPVRDGFDTIRHLRAEGYDGPIIAMSGGGIIPSREAVRYGVVLGANDMLPKPFDLGVLIAKVRKAIASKAA